MRDEEKAVLNMYERTELRKDLFSIKQACSLTGMSRSMLIKLEEKGFCIPREIDKKTGYRYYDTFNIFKILQYKRLRMLGLSQAVIYDYYDKGNEGILNILNEMKLQKKLLEQQLDLLSLRVQKEKNYSFSFYDFAEMTCLATEYDAIDIEEVNIAGYNLSVEALSRGLRPLVTEDLFGESEMPGEVLSGKLDTMKHFKAYQPIEPDIPEDADKTGIEKIPFCHTFSMLIYGYDMKKGDKPPRELLREEIMKRGLKPTGAPMRVQAIVARYTAMHLGEDEHVFRIAVPVE